MNRLFLGVLVVGSIVAAGCKDESGTGGAGPTPAPPATSTGSSAGSAGHSDAKEDHPNAVDLGEKTVAGLRLKAKQDEPVKAGGEGAFDVLITGGKPKAVRFWVGVENGEGSVKAKADEETTDNWHTHVEVPDPLPAGSKFWLEVEPAQGERFSVGFDLKK